MKYLIIGAGGTGGCLGAWLTRAGSDCTLIARGTQLSAIRTDGLSVEAADSAFTVRLKVCSSEEYHDTPDAVFLCVKGYSLKTLIPFLQRIAGSGTIFIPLLNIYTTGETLQPYLPDNTVTDGCIYIAANIAAPGKLAMHGNIFRVVFGVRRPEQYDSRLEQIRQDLADSGIQAVLSQDIRRDALIKYSYIASQAACGLCYGADAGKIRSHPEMRESFARLTDEVRQLAAAEGVSLPEDIVSRNLAILDALQPESSTSLQRDIEAGKPSEINGLLFDVIKKARRSGLTLPEFEKIEAVLHQRGL